MSLFNPDNFAKDENKVHPFFECPLPLPILLTSFVEAAPTRAVLECVGREWVGVYVGWEK